MLKSILLPIQSIFVLPISSHCVLSALMGSPPIAYVVIVDTSIIAARINQLDCISTHAINAFLIILKAFSPCFSVVKKFFNISKRTINHKVKLAIFLTIFHINRRGASRLRNHPYTMLLSRAIPARVSAGRSRR